MGSSRMAIDAGCASQGRYRLLQTLTAQMSKHAAHLAHRVHTLKMRARINAGCALLVSTRTILVPMRRQRASSADSIITVLMAQPCVSHAMKEPIASAKSIMN